MSSYYRVSIDDNEEVEKYSNLIDLISDLEFESQSPYHIWRRNPNW